MQSDPSVVDTVVAERQSMRELEPEDIRKIDSLLEEDRRQVVLAAISTWHPGEIVDLLVRLRFRQAQKLFSWLPVNLAARALSEMKPTFRATLLGGVNLPRVIRLVDELETDDAREVVAGLPPELARKVLPSLEDRSAVQELLTYADRTAGAIMSAKYVAVRTTSTVTGATRQVRARAETLDELFAVFVTERGGRLVGVVDLKTLLLSTPRAQMKDIMDENVISVRTDADQKDVARIMERYDLVALPVVDDKERLVGCVTIDDAVDVIREEASEDISLMSGVPPTETPHLPVLSVVAGRLPWLLIGLVGAGISGMVVGSFEHALRQAVILAGFIPVVMAMAGNAGIQSSAVSVQGLATGELWGSDLGRRLGREVLVAVINGLSVAVFLAIFVLLFAGVFSVPEPGKLALTAGMSLVTVVVLAGTIGATAPIVLHRMGIDPALATGPVITTSNDILGVIVFFAMATVLYLG